jgi:glycerophosphoryl diester phosphodiesterase
MFGVEILLLTILIITVAIYKKKWVPVYPPFYSTGKLVKIGHRGVPSLAHENTLDSFRKAIDTGMDGIELDVQFSADKKLVVYHNWSIESDSGEIELIENLSCPEIQKISLNGNEQNKIPLFTDVLDVLNKKIIINIEIKSAHISILVFKIWADLISILIIIFLLRTSNTSVNKGILFCSLPFNEIF